MGRAPARVQQVVEPVVTGLGYDLVGVEYLVQGHRAILRVYIDSPAGITLDDCSRVSQQLGGTLDVEDPIAGAYSLEISSPGLDRPLFGPRDYQRFCGRQVRIRLNGLLEGRRNFVGVLQGLRGDSVVVLQDGQEVVLPLDRIEKAKLVPEV